MSRVDTASRLIAAPTERVYAAFVDPAALAAWLPPTGMVARFERFDARPGGSYRMVLTYRDARSSPGKATADSDIVEARFVDLVPGVRVVQEVDFVSDDPRYAGTMTMTWEVASAGSGARVEFRADNVPVGISAEDHAAGLNSSLANLAGFLERSPIKAANPDSVDEQPVSSSDGNSHLSVGPRIQLVAATVPVLNALNDDQSLFSAMIGSPVPDGWPEFPEAIGFTLQQLQDASAADSSWSMQFFVDQANGRLVGSGGFVGPPLERTVEIGYEIAPEFRGRGFGTAAARALVEQAIAGGEVDHVIAHTLPAPNPSTGVLMSLGFEHVRDQQDPEVGVVWEWRWSRPESR